MIGATLIPLSALALSALALFPVFCTDPHDMATLLLFSASPPGGGPALTAGGGTGGGPIGSLAPHLDFISSSFLVSSSRASFSFSLRPARPSSRWVEGFFTHSPRLNSPDPLSFLSLLLSLPLSLPLLLSLLLDLDLSSLPSLPEFLPLLFSSSLSSSFLLISSLADSTAVGGGGTIAGGGWTILGGGATYPPARARTPARPLPPPPRLGARGSALGFAAIGTPGGGLESRAGGALLFLPGELLRSSPSATSPR